MDALTSTPGGTLGAKHLEGLTNIVGKFIRIDRNSLHGMNKMVASIMVELNISKGLPTKIKVIWGNRVILQKMNYLHIPFRCFYWRETGHVKARCPFLLTGAKPSRSKDLEDSPI